MYVIIENDTYSLIRRAIPNGNMCHFTVGIDFTGPIGPVLETRKGNRVLECAVAPYHSQKSSNIKINDQKIRT